MPARLPSSVSAPVPAGGSWPRDASQDVTFWSPLPRNSNQYSGANALSNKLKRAGYPAFTEAISTSRGTLWRVRVGPYPTREAAAQSRDKLKAEGHAGIVVPAK